MDLIAKAMQDRRPSRMAGGAVVDKRGGSSFAFIVEKAGTRLRTMASRTTALQLVGTAIAGFLVMVRLRPPFSRTAEGSTHISAAVTLLTLVLCCIGSVIVAYYIKYHWR